MNKMNGNDLIEYEEDNAEQLFESFAKKFSAEWEMYQNSIEEYFIEKYPEKWEKHVQDEYDNAQIARMEVTEN